MPVVPMLQVFHMLARPQKLVAHMGHIGPLLGWIFVRMLTLMDA